MVAVTLVTSFVDPFENLRIQALLLGLVVAAAATFGDLAESLVKRDMGIKDMGSILPGHGGVLDRIDSLLFVAPAAFLLYRIIIAEPRSKRSARLGVPLTHEVADDPRFHGSIGTQALDVVRRNPDRFKIVGLSAAGANQELLVGQIREFLPPSSRSRTRGRQPM